MGLGFRGPGSLYVSPLTRSFSVSNSLCAQVLSLFHSALPHSLCLRTYLTEDLCVRTLVCVHICMYAWWFAGVRVYSMSACWPQSNPKPWAMKILSAQLQQIQSPRHRTMCLPSVMLRMLCAEIEHGGMAEHLVLHSKFSRDLAFEPAGMHSPQELRCRARSGD